VSVDTDIRWGGGVTFSKCNNDAARLGHIAEKQSQGSIRFNPHLYWVRNLVERFFNKSADRDTL
jgi:hypothetical protein